MGFRGGDGWRVGGGGYLGLRATRSTGFATTDCGKSVFAEVSRLVLEFFTFLETMDCLADGGVCAYCWENDQFGEGSVDLLG